MDTKQTWDQSACTMVILHGYEANLGPKSLPGVILKSLPGVILHGYEANLGPKCVHQRHCAWFVRRPCVHLIRVHGQDLCTPNGCNQPIPPHSLAQAKGQQAHPPLKRKRGGRDEGGGERGRERERESEREREKGGQGREREGRKEEERGGKEGGGEGR